MIKFGIRVLNYIKRKIEQLIDFIRICVSLLYIHCFHKKAIVFIATPVFGNMGDHAIIRAQINFVCDLGYGANILEINSFQYHRYKHFFVKILKDDDVIAIDGGGNMGTLWLNEEMKMREIVCLFPQNPIIIFPQTAYFENNREGEEELQKSIQIYNSHSNLTIFCRDRSTYTLIKDKMPRIEAFYVPDIVLYTDDAKIHTRRSGIRICMRDDIEKTNALNLEEILYDKFPNKTLSNISTMYEGKINRKNRELLLFNKWKEFSESELIITDRLHGMIFSAITGTPCIAIDNKSHKVKQGHEWINYLKYIRFCNGSDIVESLDYIESIIGREFEYDRSRLEKYYSMIAEVLENAIED